MKKIIMIILVLIIAAGGFFAYQYFFATSAKKEALIKALPADALGVVHLYDIQDNWERFSQTPTWKVLSSLDYEGMMRRSNASPEDIENFRRFKSGFNEIFTNPTLKSVFDKQVTMALYPSQIDFFKLTSGTASSEDLVEMGSKLFSSVVFAFRIPIEVQVAEFVSRFGTNFGPNVTADETQYNERTIYRLNFKDTGISIGYVRFGDVLIWGLGEEPARRAIDTMYGAGESLADNPRYQRFTQERLDASASEIYWNSEASMNLFMKEMESMASLADGDNDSAQQFQDVTDEMMKSAEAFKSFGMFVSLDEKLRVKMAVDFDRSKLSGDMASFYKNCSPVKNQSLEMVPEFVLGYQWGNCLNLDEHWKRIQKEVSRLEEEGDDASGAAQEKIESFEARLGLDIENDVLAAIGDEFGGFLIDIQTGGMFPLPQLVLFIKTDDRSAMDRLLNKLNEMPFASMIQKESYKDVDVNFIMANFNGVQPAYAYIGDYLTVALRKDDLLASIDVKNSQSLNFLESQKVKDLGIDFSVANNGVQYLHIGEIASKIKGLVNFGLGWSEQQEKKKNAFRAGGEKRLDEVQNEIESLTQEVRLIEDEIWNIENRAVEVAGDIEKVKALKADLEMKQNSLSDVTAEEGQLVEIVSGYSQSAVDPQEKEYYLNEVLYPLLKGLEEVGAMGARVTIDMNRMEMILNMEM